MILEIKDLYKSFGDVKAVDGLTFSVREGEFFAFLGVNGAGKSTTINIVCGILKKDEGIVKVCGERIDQCPEKVKLSLGVVFQNSVLDKNLTVLENLKCRAALYGIGGENFKRRLSMLDELLGLQDILRRPVKVLSGGQRRRADIARALLHAPKLLILDEPTTGLDPKTRRTVWRVIETLRKEQGLTVFLTTHYMEEAAEADDVVILDAGKKVAEGSPHALKKRYASDILRLYANLDEAERFFSAQGASVKRGRDFLDVSLQATGQVKTFLLERPDLFDDFEVFKGDMDSVFLRVTGREISERGEGR